MVRAILLTVVMGSFRRSSLGLWRQHLTLSPSLNLHSEVEDILLHPSTSMLCGLLSVFMLLLLLKTLLVIV
jgi:hypothetical protein